MSDNTNIIIDSLSKNKEPQSSNIYYKSRYYVYFNYKSEDPYIKISESVYHNNKDLIDMRFKYRYPTQDEMNEILSTYINGEFISKTYGSHSGKDTGFIWIKNLTAMAGYEQTEINNFIKIAYEIAYKTNLLLDGPLCNVNWH